MNNIFHIYILNLLSSVTAHQSPAAKPDLLNPALLLCMQVLCMAIWVFLQRPLRSLAAFWAVLNHIAWCSTGWGVGRNVWRRLLENKTGSCVIQVDAQAQTDVSAKHSLPGITSACYWCFCRALDVLSVLSPRVGAGTTNTNHSLLNSAFLFVSARQQEGANDQVTQLRGHWELGKAAAFWAVFALKQCRFDARQTPESYSLALPANQPGQKCAVAVTATCPNSSQCQHIAQCSFTSSAVPFLMKYQPNWFSITLSGYRITPYLSISIFYKMMIFNSLVRKCYKAFTAVMLTVLLVLKLINCDHLKDSTLKYSEGWLVQPVQNMRK